MKSKKGEMDVLRDFAVDIIKTEQRIVTADELKKRIRAIHPDFNPSTLTQLLSSLEKARPGQIGKPFRGAYIYKQDKK
jgi:hypothetical protein